MTSALSTSGAGVARAVVVAGLLCASTIAGLPAQTVAETEVGVSLGRYAGAYSMPDVEPGAAFAVAAGRHVGRMAVLVGYERAGFGCITGFCAGAPVRYVTAGPFVAVRAQPWRRSSLAATLELRAGWHTLRARWHGAEGPVADRSEAALAVGVGIGVRLPLLAGVSIQPTLRVQTYRTQFDGGNMRHRVLSGGAVVGIRYAFGS